MIDKNALVETQQLVEISKGIKDQFIKENKVEIKEENNSYNKYFDYLYSMIGLYNFQQFLNEYDLANQEYPEDINLPLNVYEKLKRSHSKDEITNVTIKFKFKSGLIKELKGNLLDYGWE